MAYSITRWENRDMPEMVRPLLSEGLAGGYLWLERFETIWNERPFLEPGEGLFIAVENGEALGMASIRRNPFSEEACSGRLGFIFISGKARKRGIAEALVVACLRHGDAHWDKVTLHTDNPVAEALYRRHGFVPIAGGADTTHQRG